MKKYKLKKDLPLAKAGEIVIVKKNFGNTPTYRVYKYKEEDKYRTGTLLASIDEKDLDLWLEEFEREEKSIFNLKKGDDYYILLDSGTVYLTNWCNTSIDKQILYANNVFLTEEEAEKENKKRKIIVKIKKYCWENKIDNSLKEGKNCFFRNKNGKILFLTLENIYLSPIGYFYYEDAKKILENFEEDLKFLFDNF